MKVRCAVLVGLLTAAASSTMAQEETPGRKKLAAAVEVFNRYTVGSGGITAYSDDLARSDDGSTTIRKLSDCVYGMEVAPPFENHLDIIDFSKLTGQYSWSAGNPTTLTFQGNDDKTRCFQIGNGQACTRNIEMRLSRYFLQSTIDDIILLRKDCAD